VDTGAEDGYRYRRALTRLAAARLMTVALLGSTAGGALAADGDHGY